MKKKIIWYASGGDILKAGPFESQVEAWVSMRLTKKEQDRQKSIHPQDTKVWCEYGKEGC